MNKLSLKLIEEANERLKRIATLTPLQFNKRLSEKYKATIYLKREDLQIVRSYKLRGAYNMISQLNKEERLRGIVCASAGNHAQGVAFSCSKLKIHGYVYMPQNTPKQKIECVKTFGGKWVSIELVGDTYDKAYEYAKKFCDKEKKIFVHPFDDIQVMAGQGTVGLEILEQLFNKKPDYVVVPVGGGGLLAGLGTYIKSKSNSTKIIGVEPAGAPSLTKALEKGHILTLEKIDKFVDGASVKTVGKYTFKISKNIIDTILTTDEGMVCEEMISLYQKDGIIAEPAGALSVAGLNKIRGEIKNKIVVCVISGGNNDISRYPEILEKSLVYKGLKHYFIIEFPQRHGALRDYLNNVLGPKDDIVLFEYLKKNNKETGPALVGIEISKKDGYNSILKKMELYGIKYQVLNSESILYKFLI